MVGREFIKTTLGIKVWTIKHRKEESGRFAVIYTGAAPAIRKWGGHGSGSSENCESGGLPQNVFRATLFLKI